MPFVSVPLERPSATPTIKIFYRTIGNGTHPVILIPGLCVPPSMYHYLAAILAETKPFLPVLISNRGIEPSDCPSATLFNAPGFTTKQLALDTWAVIDDICEDGMVGVVGHSMGGMVAQEVVRLRPKRVAFLGLLSTHYGGWWESIPTFGMLAGGLKMLWNRLDPDVSASVNLNLHYTPRFLSESFDQRAIANASGHERITHDMMSTEVDSASEEMLEEHIDDEVGSSMMNAEVECISAASQTNGPTPSGLRSRFRNAISDTETAARRRLSFLEMKLHEFTRDARLHFGLTRRHFFESLLPNTRTWLTKLSTRRNIPGVHRRFDIYHSQYSGRENNANISTDEIEHVPFHTTLAHYRVVWSHTLASSFASQLRSCNRIYKLVMMGRHDRVIARNSSWRLGGSIGAQSIVEVDAAHFIVDEAAAEVTTNIIYGLRQGLLRHRGCECVLCEGD